MNPYVGLWSRLDDFEPEVLSNLIAERAVVRVALMRSTIHLVSARDCLELRPLVQVVSERGYRAAFGKQAAGLDVHAVVREGRAILTEQPLPAAALGRRLQARWPDYARRRVGEPRAHARGARAGATEGTVGQERGQRAHSCRHLARRTAREGPVTRRPGAALPRGIRPRNGARRTGVVGTHEARRGVRPPPARASSRFATKTAGRSTTSPTRRDRLAMSTRRRASSPTSTTSSCRTPTATTSSPTSTARCSWPTTS